ncbi:unnamed protein product [Ostreobium quekettii]|uniref:RNA cytidine acetyltransferase n=1 Tax=Ostreobium quekettii TaxID=121088 RepID=A0A8S1IVN3_9CHLO|nr:unnamed protein product [Ostreobium quekettii]
MGIAISAAIALGYSNIFVTAPSPENLRTLFEFLFKGLDALEYKEHIDYDLVESTNPALGKAIIRVNVFRHHRQTVQYILPQHHAKLSQAELVVIDEAAAIPLPIVKALLGPYLVFLCSTVNGYEGTGRSLSLKLISQLREQGAKASGADAKEGALGRTLREVTLEQPIRYAPGDHVERWLNNLLCLDCADDVPKPPLRLPHPDECELFYVERDTLFSYHKASEVFLRRMVSLYVASHYKNQPNDLMLMSDAPAHHLFVLLGPVDETQNALPDILCVLQVALEGQISRKLVMSSMSHGSIPQGDLIPWIVGQQFQDSEFPRLSGARIVRIAVHPDLGRAGYGTKALELLCRYYEGEIVNVLDENDDGPSAVAADTDGPRQQNDRDQQQPENGEAGPGPGSQLLSEELKPRSGLPPLLVNLTDRRPEKLHYLGSSFGLTLPLFNFWRKCGYRPLYLRQTPSEVTGEHTIVVLKPLQSPDVEGTNWLEPFVVDFRKRFIALLGRNFRTMEPALALSILAPKLVFSEQESQEGITGGITVAGVDGGGLLPHDLKRLQSYSNNLVDHHMILDLVPALARAYFCGKLPATLSHGQAAILMGVGLQQLDITDVEKSLGLPSNQVLALFSKSVRKLYSYLLAAKEEGVGRELPKPKEIVLLPHDKDVEEELEEAGRQIQGAIRAQLQPEALREFAIEGGDEEFGDALSKDGLKAGKLVSIKKSVKASAGSAKEAGAHGGERKKGAKRKKLGGSGKGKKRRQ